VWVIIVVLALIIVGIVYASNHVSGYQLQKKIGDALSDRGITATNIHCPDNINTDKGSTTSCTAVIQGATKTLSIVFDSDRHFVITAVQ
jgi:hypothetical protein